MSVRALVSTTRLTAATCGFHAGKRPPLALTYQGMVYCGMIYLQLGNVLGKWGMCYILEDCHIHGCHGVYDHDVLNIACSLSKTTCNKWYRHVAQRFTRQNSHLEDVVISQCQPCDGVGGCGWPIHSICGIDKSTSTQPQKWSSNPASGARCDTMAWAVFT